MDGESLWQVLVAMSLVGQQSSEKIREEFHLGPFSEVPVCVLHSYTEMKLSGNKHGLIHGILE